MLNVKKVYIKPHLVFHRLFRIFKLKDDLNVPFLRLAESVHVYMCKRISLCKMDY